MENLRATKTAREKKKQKKFRKQYLYDRERKKHNFFSILRELTHLYTAKNQKSLAPFVILLRRIFEARTQCLFTLKKRHPIFKTMTFTLVPIPRELFGPVTCGFFLVKEEAFVLHLSYSLHSEPLSS